jgi:malonyl-CoA/methylmalonyl-CoA synthetase
MLQLIEKAYSYTSRIAINSGGLSYTYANLLEASHQMATWILDGQADLQEKPVAFMVDPGFEYVSTQWGIWRSGGIAVPLCITHPLPSLTYVLEDTGASILVVSPVYENILRDYAAAKGIRLLVLGVNQLTDKIKLPSVAAERCALILYTSGTTSLPKGVVTTHINLEAQISTLIEAWDWRSTDHILCILPLHHVHGIVNVVCCSLWAGATCTFMPSFDPTTVFSLFSKNVLTVFMAVPTIYYKLISHWEQLDATQQTSLRKSMQAFRLMVCGSAALPVSVMEKWEQISGHRLLERYGMTEIGMAISNPLHGERRAGYIGVPLPGVSVQLVDDQFVSVPDGEPGLILVKGKNVFSGYWNRPIETNESFTEDGWFKTGDVAIIENGYYRIMGRQSVDIIKSGGYKISALEIEEELRKHTAIADVAVVGIPDDEWGERVVAAIVLSEKSINPTAELTSWLRDRIPSYRVPRVYKAVDALPRNAMGKVVKNDVKKLFNNEAI